MSSDATAFGFGKFIPGFDFLQGLAKGAGAAAQPLGKVPEWVAPTVSIEEVDKRVAELKAVQFWLEQNSRALAATIQALEVQRMTLATLKGMNVSMAELAKSFTFPPGAAGAAHNAFADAMSWGKGQNPSPESAAASDYSHWPMGGGQEAEAEQPAQPEPAPKAEGERKTAGAKAGRKAAKEAVQEAVQDVAAAQTAAMNQAMNWWGALTQQFQHIASKAMAEPVHEQAMQAAQRARDMAGNLAKTAMDSAKAQAEKMVEAGKMAQAQMTQAAAQAPAPKPAARKAPAKAAKAAKAEGAGRAAAKPSRSPQAAAKAPAAKQAAASRRGTRKPG